MSLLFYTIFLKLYLLGIRIASLWNDKAKQWLNGRKKFPFIKNAEGANDTIWMHCASLGEFEQGRPLIEKIRTAYPLYKIVITFFSIRL
ncbi:MAG: glycosyltransferase N-terminal domain-containing protein [Chitinophagaceae bacterium]